KNENRILRDQIPDEIHTKPHERTLLLKYGQPLGTAINELITNVTPGTFHCWIREEKKGRKKISSVGQERVQYCENWFSRSPGKQGSAILVSWVDFRNSAFPGSAVRL
ncbi:MAG TPA: hypothetical protein DCM07_33625, partial [Planctomycetaceae bacterium]|nr:hypothetical protein [Planctomycetaceae bacterium]